MLSSLAISDDESDNEESASEGEAIDSEDEVDGNIMDEAEGTL